MFAKLLYLILVLFHYTERQASGLLFLCSLGGASICVLMLLLLVASGCYISQQRIIFTIVYILLHLVLFTVQITLLLTKIIVEYFLGYHH